MRCEYCQLSPPSRARSSPPGCNRTTPPAGAAPTGANAYEMAEVVWVAPRFDAASIQFSDGRMSGAAPCNSYSGAIPVDWPAFGLADDMISTAMSCPNDAVEQAYFAALRAATRAVIAGDGALVLSNDSGPLIRFEPE